jgi:hypothetical protein
MRAPLEVNENRAANANLGGAQRPLESDISHFSSLPWWCFVVHCPSLRGDKRAKITDGFAAEQINTIACNIKVVVQNGAVTSKGPVRTEDDKKALEYKATEAAGEGKITGELKVKPEK